MDHQAVREGGTRWAFIGMIAACCAGPMLAIVALVTVFGFALGSAAAIALGVAAAAGCVVLAVAHHREGGVST